MLKRLFQDHPASVDESYFEHFRFALSFAGLLLMAGGAALVHALIPGLCQKTASTIINRLHHKMHNRAPHHTTHSQPLNAIIPAE